MSYRIISPFTSIHPNWRFQQNYPEPTVSFNITAASQSNISCSSKIFIAPPILPHVGQFGRAVIVISTAILAIPKLLFRSSSISVNGAVSIHGAPNIFNTSNIIFKSTIMTHGVTSLMSSSSINSSATISKTIKSVITINSNTLMKGILSHHSKANLMS